MSFSHDMISPMAAGAIAHQQGLLLLSMRASCLGECPFEQPRSPRRARWVPQLAQSLTLVPVKNKIPVFTTNHRVSYIMLSTLFRAGGREENTTCTINLLSTSFLPDVRSQLCCPDLISAPDSTVSAPLSPSPPLPLGRTRMCRQLWPASHRKDSICTQAPPQLWTSGPSLW